MKINFKIFLLLIFLLIAKLSAIAQTYDFHNFNVEDGLAQSQILSMCQDRNGNIWYGTNNGGVSKYDGNKFTNYTENDSLINNVVFSITELKNGNLLFGTNGGLSILNGKKFTNISEKNGLISNHVYKVMEDNNGTVWIGTAKGVCQLKNNNIIPFTSDTLLNQVKVFCMYQDKANNIWFGTIGNGAIKYSISSKKFSYYTIAQGLQNNFVRAINEDLQGNIYLGTNSGINKITTEGKLEKVNIPGQENIAFTAIIPDNKNNLWLATSEGVFKYNGYTFRKYNSKNGLASDKLMCGLQDREDNFWFGTDGFGISKFTGEAFVSYSSKDNLPGDYIKCIFQDSKKNVWMGVKDFGVVCLTKEKIVNYKCNIKDIKNSLADNDVWVIAEDKKGIMYFGTRAGLSIYDGQKFHNYSKKDGLPEDNILSLYVDEENTIWIGTTAGLCYFKNNKFVSIDETNTQKFEKNIPVYYIYADRNNSFWLATENGVIKYDHNSFQRYNKSNGFTDKRVISVLQDRSGYLWFGTDEGVFYYNYTTFENININKGLAANKVYLLLLNKDFLWVGTNNGIDKIDLQLLHSNNTIKIKHFGKEEGLKGVECNSNAQMQDDQGNLWFGTIKGATVYNPNYDKINHNEALTRITAIRLFFQNADSDLNKFSKGFDNTTNLPVSLVLPYDKNHITFDFIGVCITNPNKVKYQFKLDGADEDWFPPTSKTEATYSSLPAGEYTFHLKAMNNDGLWNEKDVTFKFTILPPWYKTWWFYSLIAFVAFGSIYLFIVVRTRNLQNAKIELEQEVELRTFQLRQEKEKVEIVNKEVTEQKAIIEAKNHDITDSIKYAKNIQEALLPPLQNLHNELKEAFVLYLPKDIVSGDFYWFAKRNKKRFIASVDCTGHGVPGAFMSIIGNTLLNEIVSDKNVTQPAEILNELHAGVKTALKQSGDTGNERRDGMDIALCSLNEEGTILEYAGANRPLWIFRKNKNIVESFEMIKSNKFPIGGLEMENETKRTFTNHVIPVEEGDIIYIFSDGYADQFGGAKGKKFMVGNMQKLVADIYQKPINEQEQILLNNFLNWKGELEQIDDVLVIGFRI
ncbi:MAG: triple tyrosine motif-containing protein [Bacteroidetes bacterium]|nr:triple tyrosine motif-containing protein [Bacteroidota bacterium]